jgi:hypothetical protein
MRGRGAPPHLVDKKIEVPVEPVEEHSEVVVIPHVRGTSRFERRTVIREAEYPAARCKHIAGEAPVFAIGDPFRRQHDPVEQPQARTYPGQLQRPPERRN